MISEVLEVIKDVSTLGITTIIVTHEINFAKSISDRIIFMDEGKIVADDNPSSFFNENKNNRIINFINKVAVHQ